MQVQGLFEIIPGSFDDISRSPKVNSIERFSEAEMRVYRLYSAVFGIDQPESWLGETGWRNFRWVLDL